MKSNYPSGYGGHIPLQGHRVMFLSSQEAVEIFQREKNKERDAFGGFDNIIKGIPSYTLNARYCIYIYIYIYICVCVCVCMCV